MGRFCVPSEAIRAAMAAVVYWAVRNCGNSDRCASGLRGAVPAAAAAVPGAAAIEPGVNTTTCCSSSGPLLPGQGHSQTSVDTAPAHVSAQDHVHNIISTSRSHHQHEAKRNYSSYSLRD